VLAKVRKPGLRMIEGLEVSPRAGLNDAFYCFRTCVGTVWFGAGIANQVTVTVEAGDKHWAIVLIATRLVT